MFGKIIVLDQENGKEQAAGKRSPSVAATMIKPPRTPRYFPKHIELYNLEIKNGFSNSKQKFTYSIRIHMGRLYQRSLQQVR